MPLPNILTYNYDGDTYLFGHGVSPDNITYVEPCVSRIKLNFDGSIINITGIKFSIYPRYSTDNLVYVDASNLEFDYTNNWIYCNIFIKPSEIVKDINYPFAYYQPPNTSVYYFIRRQYCLNVYAYNSQNNSISNIVTHIEEIRTNNSTIFLEKPEQITVNVNVEYNQLYIEPSIPLDTGSIGGYELYTYFFLVDYLTGEVIQHDVNSSNVDTTSIDILLRGKYYPLSIESYNIRLYNNKISTQTTVLRNKYDTYGLVRMYPLSKMSTNTKYYIHVGLFSKLHFSNIGIKSPVTLDQIKTNPFVSYAMYPIPVSPYSDPDPPSISSTTPLYRSISILFTQSNTGGYPISRYKLVYTINNEQSAIEIPYNDPTYSTPLLVENLTPYQPYTFNISSYNQYMYSPTSTITSIVVPTDIPRQPIIQNITYSPTNSTCTISVKNSVSNYSVALTTNYPSWGIWSGVTIDTSKLYFSCYINSSKYVDVYYSSTTHDTQNTYIQIPYSLTSTPPPASSMQVVASNTAITSTISTQYNTSPTITGSITSNLDFALSINVVITPTYVLTPITQIQYSTNGSTIYTTIQPVYSSGGIFQQSYRVVMPSNTVFFYNSIKFRIVNYEGTSNEIIATNVYVYSNPAPPTIVSVTPALRNFTVITRQPYINAYATTYTLTYKFTNTANNQTTTFVLSGNPFTEGQLNQVNCSQFSGLGLDENSNYTLTVEASNVSNLKSSTQYAQTIRPYYYPSTPVITSLETRYKSLAVYFTQATTGGYPIVKYEMDISYGQQITQYTTTSSLVSPIIIPDLVEGGIYKITNIKAYNTYVASSAGISTLTVVPYDIPATPTFTLEARFQSTLIHIDTPQYLGYADILKYTVYVNGVPDDIIESTVSTGIWYKLTPIPNGGSYSIQLSISNRYATSPISPAQTVIPYDVPDKITDLSAIPLNSALKISFTVPNSNNSPITLYQYFVFNVTTSQSLGWKPFIPTISQEVNASYIITDLPLGNSYFVRVSSQNAGGVSAPSAPTSPVSVATYPSKPATPSISYLLSSVDINPNGVLSITGIVPNNGASQIIEYTMKIYRSAVITDTAETATLIGTLTETGTYAIGQSIVRTFNAITQQAYYSATFAVKNELGYSLDSSMSQQIMVQLRPSPQMVSATMNYIENYVYVRYTNRLFEIGNPPAQLTYKSYIGGVFKQIINIALVNASTYTYEGYIPLNVGEDIRGKNVRVEFVFSNTTSTTPIISISFPPSPPVLVSNANIYDISNQTIALAFNSDQYNLNSTQFSWSINGSTFSTDMSYTSIKFQSGSPILPYPSTLILRATNSIGSSLNSAETQLMFPPNQPPAPVLTAGKNSVAVSFSGSAQTISNMLAQIQNSSPISGFIYELKNMYTSQILLQDRTANVNLPFQIQGLTENTGYTVRLIAVNQYGQSLWGQWSNTAIPYSSPLAPTNINAIARNRGATVSFTASVSNSSPIISYTYTIINMINYNQVQTATIAPSASATQQFDVVGLTASVPYSVNIFATNIAGNSPVATISSYVIPYKEPDQPLAPFIVAGKQMLLVETMIPNSNGSSITLYRYTAYIIGENGQYIQVAQNESEYTITNIYGLTANVRYYVTVSAFNEAGWSLVSNVSSGVPYKEPEAPFPPVLTKMFKGIMCNVGSAFPENNSSPITSFKLFLYENDVELATYTLNIHNFYLQIDNLVADMSYTMKSCAVNAGGQSALSPVSNVVHPYGYPPLAYDLSFAPLNRAGKILYKLPTNPFNPITTVLIEMWKTITDNEAENFGEFSIYDTATLNVDIGKDVYEYTDDNANEISETYYYRIKTRNQIWADEYTDYVSGSPYREPEIITGLVLQPAYKSAILSFDPPIDYGNSIFSYLYVNINTGRTGEIFVDRTMGITQITIPNLQEGVPISFLLAGQNDAGYSQYSTGQQPSNVVVPYTYPSKPTITVFSGDSSARVAVSGDNGYSPIISYKYYLNGNVDPHFTEVFTTDTSFNVEGLENGTPYTITVKMANVQGYSPLSEPSAPFTPFGLPSIPSIAYELIDTYLYVDISVNRTAGLPLLAYSYSLYNDGMFINYPIVAGEGEGLPYLRRIQIKVRFGISYAIVFRAETEKGYSAGLTDPILVALPPSRPEAPEITQIKVDASYLTVDFVPSFYNGSNITQYLYSVNNGYYVEVDATNDTSRVVITEYKNENGEYVPIMPKTTYSVVIVAVNSIGYSEPSQEFSQVFTPDVPSIPVINRVVFGEVLGNIEVVFSIPIDYGAPILSYSYILKNANTGDVVKYGTVDDQYIEKIGGDGGANIEGILAIDSIDISANYNVELSATNRVGSSLSSIFVFNYQTPQLTSIEINSGNSYGKIAMDIQTDVRTPIIGVQYQVDNGTIYFKDKDGNITIVRAVDIVSRNVKGTKRTSVYRENTALYSSRAIEDEITSFALDATGLTNEYHVIRIWVVNDVGTSLPTEMAFYPYYIPPFNLASTPANVQNQTPPTYTVNSSTQLNVDYCEQKRLGLLYNVPPTRLNTISPYDLGFTAKDLDMRRKAEILKYSSNKMASQTNNMTKKEKFSNMSKYITQKAMNTSFLVDLCGNPACRPPMPTSASGVPGPLVYLYEDPNVPLYNLNTFNLYSYSSIITITESGWNFNSQTNISIDEEGSSFGTLLIGNTINTNYLTFEMNIPFGINIRGGGGGMGETLAENVIYKVAITSIKYTVYFDKNVAFETTVYNPATLSAVYFKKNSAFDTFAITKYFGNVFFPTYTLYTLPTFAYNVVIKPSIRIDTFNATTGVPVVDGGNAGFSRSVVANMTNDINYVKNCVLVNGLPSV